MPDLPGGDAAHEAVAAVLAVTPLPPGDHPSVPVAYEVEPLPHGGQVYRPLVGDPAPIAARQAAAVLRWLSGWLEQRDTNCDDPAAVAQLAEEIDPKESRDDRR